MTGHFAVKLVVLVLMSTMYHYIPVSHDMMRQMNDCSPVRVMQHKVMYFLCVRVGPDPWAELQVDPALGPTALGLGRPGALPAGLVQPCPKPRALFHKHITESGVLTYMT